MCGRAGAGGWRTRAPGSLHALLKEKDPRAAAAIRASDGQRIVRALEVFDASGRSIAEMQATKGEPLVAGEHCEKLLIMPDRETLYRNIEARLDVMVERGAIDEVARLRARKLDPALPAMKAIGVPEFSACLDGELSIDEAVARAKTATRRYAKRQMTWFRNQLGDGWTFS